MALIKFDELKDLEAKKEIEHLTAHYENAEDYFIEEAFSSRFATIAAAFYPNEL
ncbi:MAG: hypothetical protein MZU97_02170 [Bacillus subtilis]|nr:hypothetical protein [Bacillus subtilis]